VSTPALASAHLTYRLLQPLMPCILWINCLHAGTRQMFLTVRGSEVALVQKWLQFVSTKALVLECKRTPLHGEAHWSQCPTS
jgi:hypothetical protein